MTKLLYVRNSIESLDKGADIGYLAGNDENLESIIWHLRYFRIYCKNILKKVKIKKIKNQ